MPRKSSAPRATPGTASLVATPASANSGPQPSLLERLRDERARGFHSSERERLMTTEIGRQTYADARRDVPLVERVLLFERIVEESLQAHRLELLCYERHAREASGAEIALHKGLMAPLVPAWLRAVATVQALALPADDQEIVALRDTAVRELRIAAARASEGDSQEAARARFDARWNLDGVAHRLRTVGRAEDAARWTAVAEDVERSWPSARDLYNVTTKAFHEGVAAGERSRDLQAIARWFAPVLGQQCVEAGLDPTVLREVGNTLLSAGGGLAHLAKVWPEQRARIQVLADRASAHGADRAMKTPEHGPAFEWILVRGDRYEFLTDRQRRSVQLLWEAQGRPVHEDVIRDAVGAEDCARFRLDHTFRRKGRLIPAWGKIIVETERGSRTYRLVR